MSSSRTTIRPAKAPAAAEAAAGPGPGRGAATRAGASPARAAARRVRLRTKWRGRNGSCEVPKQWQATGSPPRRTLATAVVKAVSRSAEAAKPAQARAGTRRRSVVPASAATRRTARRRVAGGFVTTHRGASRRTEDTKPSNAVRPRTLLTADTQNTRARRIWHATWTWDIGGNPRWTGPGQGLFRVEIRSAFEHRPVTARDAVHVGAAFAADDASVDVGALGVAVGGTGLGLGHDTAEEPVADGTDQGASSSSGASSSLSAGPGQQGLKLLHWTRSTGPGTSQQ